MRRTNFPPWDLATRYSYRAVRRLPTCIKPVGLGANLVLTVAIVVAPCLWYTGPKRPGKKALFIIAKNPCLATKTSAPPLFPAGLLQHLEGSPVKTIFLYGEEEKLTN